MAKLVGFNAPKIELKCVSCRTEVILKYDVLKDALVCPECGHITLPLVSQNGNPIDVVAE